MKKFFLIAGLIAGIGATNGYADIVISQPDDNSDMIVTVARATKGKTRIAPQPTDKHEPVNVEPGSIIKVSSGWSEIRCPEGCVARSYTSNNGNTMVVECVDSNGKQCYEQEEVTQFQNMHMDR